MIVLTNQIRDIASVRLPALVLRNTDIVSTVPLINKANLQFWLKP